MLPKTSLDTTEMKKLLLSAAAILFATIGFTQTTIYQETFETGNTFSLNTSDLGASTIYNTWLMNNVYAGGAGAFICLGFPFSFTVANTVNQPIAITGAPSSNYMHIAAQSAISNGITCASYLPADGVCALDESNFSKMTAPISTLGFTGVDFSFWWMCAGSVTAFGEVYYSLDNGVTWVLKQSTLNNVVNWTQMILNDVAWDNQSSLMFGFRFVNTTAATAADPAFSVDEIIVTGMAPVNTITTTNDFTPASWCQGSTTVGTVNFVSTGVYNAGNIYSAEFSDAAGSFLSPVVIGTLASSASGSLSISVAVTGATPSGAGYRVRVVASDPATIGSDNSTDIIINTPPTVAHVPFTDVCEDLASFPLTGGTPMGGTYTGTGVAAGMFDPSVAGPGTSTITYDYIDGNGCSSSAFETITVLALPTVTFSALVDMCSAAGSYTLVEGMPVGGSYSGSGVSGGVFDPAIAGVGVSTLSYNYTDGNGCSAVATQTVSVDDCSEIDETYLSSVILFPNPAKTSFSISENTLVDEVVITDMNGRVVMSFENQSSYGIASLMNGVYMVNISSNGIQIKRRLIIF